MPFLSLRRRSSQNPQDDKRKLGRRSLRAFRKLPLARDKAEEEYYYYEAHTSFLVTGVDEWFWTLYCCVDTYFGSEPEYRTYLDGQYGSDPATGGFLWLKFPRWNPREYFLVVLSRRMMQATREWRALIDAFEERMEEYEERTLFDFRDDLRLSRTKELTLAVSTLRRFRDSLSRTVDAWSIFEQRDIQTFHVTINDAFRQRCEGHLANVRGNISELQSLQTLISQKLELFNSMRDGLVNASALRESAAATRQGEYIGLLTRMTVFYLPLSLSTALFSISMVPSSNITWVYYIIVCLTTTAITLYVAAYPKLLGIFFHTGDDIMAKERKIPGST
ncbi:hypothetical protein K432DRAFT_284700 [Lepidopterella palustris CBS 459.81]|uniref:Uncharacterized protein n=1 Tax=Lepidopterella palustris CBS 459.81 TaxID=1314670 RepID=A0A8E2JKV9_9PEZI|nr:hypothetical protein K432DRAFT_284700 [Lepidopterella palustris CBS 459.81]